MPVFLAKLCFSKTYKKIIVSRETTICIYTMLVNNNIGI